MPFYFQTKYVCINYVCFCMLISGKLDGFDVRFSDGQGPVSHSADWGSFAGECSMVQQRGSLDHSCMFLVRTVKYLGITPGSVSCESNVFLNKMEVRAMAFCCTLN
jgi:hypothetical protein